MKIGFLAKKASQMILFLLIKFENYIRNLAKPKNVFFLQLRSNEGIISCYQEEYKCLMCKIILAVCLYREKNLNQSLKMQNKLNSSVKEGTFTKIT